MTAPPLRQSPRRALSITVLLSVVSLAGCTHTVKVEPIKVEPIDITLHIYLEADQKLDAFFSDIEEPTAPPTPAAPSTSTTPAGQAPSEGAKQ
ncbi:MAG: hypothetical protein H7Y88_12145 [Phycisphaerales bacterium]|nr:hypothetical protein [Phycisphaerales bacterium]